MADGTIVTTTRYETRHGNSTQTATHKKYSNLASTKTEHKSALSSTHVQSCNKVVNDSKHSTHKDQRYIEHVNKPEHEISDTSSRDHHRNDKYTRQDQTTKISRESHQKEYSSKHSDVNTQQHQKTVVDDIDNNNDQHTTTSKTVTRKFISEEIPQEHIRATHQTSFTNEHQAKDIQETKKIKSNFPLSLNSA